MADHRKEHARHLLHLLEHDLTVRCALTHSIGTGRIIHALTENEFNQMLPLRLACVTNTLRISCPSGDLYDTGFTEWLDCAVEWLSRAPSGVGAIYCEFTDQSEKDMGNEESVFEYTVVTHLF